MVESVIIKIVPGKAVCEEALQSAVKMSRVTMPAGRADNVPAKICELLVDSLESHNGRPSVREFVLVSEFASECVVCTFLAEVISKRL